MPRIKQYVSTVAPQGGVFNRATGQEFGAGVGTQEYQFGGSLINTGQKLQDSLDRADVADVQTNMAVARSQWTGYLGERLNSAQAGDPEFADKFNADFQDYLNKTRESVRTRAGQAVFDNSAKALQAHFMQASVHAQTILASNKAVLDYTKTADANANTLMNDPTQFGDILAESKAALSDPAGPYAVMQPDQREKLQIKTQQQLAASAVQGIIQSDPEMALKQLTGPNQWDQYLDPSQKATLERQAKSAINAQRVQAEYAQAQAERAQRDTSMNALNDWLGKIEAGKASATDIVNDNRLTPAAKENAVRWMKFEATSAATGKPAKSNPDTFLDLQRRISMDPSDTLYLDQKKLDEQGRALVQNGTLTLPDLLKLELQQRDLQKGTPLARQVSQIESSGARAIIGINPTAAGGAIDFQRYVSESVASEQAAGRDPMQTVLNPNNKDFVLTQANIERFTHPPKQSVADKAANTRAQGAATPGDQQILLQAEQQFPVVRSAGAVVTKSTPQTPYDDRKLEFWGPGEKGTPDDPRPKNLPLDRPGIQVFSSDVKPSDVAADVVSHYLVRTNPQLHAEYSQFVATFNDPTVMARLREDYKWAQQHENEKRPFKEWATVTRIPAYLRGYIFHQWPDSARQGRFTPQQRAILDQMAQTLHGAGTSAMTGTIQR